MVDLDELAERRALALNQDKESWRAVIWDARFQKLTQSMTDGEVEDFISLCPSTQHFDLLVRHLEAETTSPFSSLLEFARQAGVGPIDFVRSLKN